MSQTNTTSIHNMIDAEIERIARAAPTTWQQILPPRSEEQARFETHVVKHLQNVHSCIGTDLACDIGDTIVSTYGVVVGAFSLFDSPAPSPLFDQAPAGCLVYRIASAGMPNKTPSIYCVCEKCSAYEKTLVAPSVPSSHPDVFIPGKVSRKHARRT